MLCLLILLLSYGYLSSRLSKEAINNCSEVKEGRVVSVKRAVGKSPVLHYRFNLDGEEYRGSQTVTNKYDLEKLKRIRKLSVRYQCDKPENSMVEFSRDK